MGTTSGRSIFNRIFELPVRPSFPLFLTFTTDANFDWGGAKVVGALTEQCQPNQRRNIVLTLTLMKSCISPSLSTELMVMSPA